MNDSCLLATPPTAAMPAYQPASAGSAQGMNLDGWLGLILGPLLLVAMLLAAIWAGHDAYAERERTIATRTALAYSQRLAQTAAAQLATTLTHAHAAAVGGRPGTSVDAAAISPADRGDIEGKTLLARLQGTMDGTRRLERLDFDALAAPLAQITLDRHGSLILQDQAGRMLWQTPAPPQEMALSRTAARQLPAGGATQLDDGSTRLVAHAEIHPHGLRLSIVSDLDAVLNPVDASRGGIRGWGWSLAIALVATAAALVSIAHRQRRLYRELKRASDANNALIARLRDESSRAYQLASYDNLTGLPNRMLFSELANSHLTRARRSHAPFVMMFLDLDRFKPINDTLGHRVGDLLLQEIARRLRSSVREADIVARLGGDEFVLLLTELDTIDDASKIAAKLIEAIGQPMQLDGHDIEIRPSIGIAIHPRDGLDVEALMRNADTAMYEAKRSGSGRFHYYDPSLNSRSSLQLDLSGRFRRAILGNEFVLHYQPRVALNGFRVTSLEALIRWQHPQRGLVPPGEFIEYAEQEGLVVELGNWVVREACRQIAEWLAAGLDVVPIAINVSPKQLRDQRFVDVIRESVGHHGIRPSLLEIEITERCVVEDFERPRAALETLSALGLKIALDDYGTGFSSLSYLKRLPIDIIKIDRSFISDLRNQTNDAAIVASTIALGHNLGLTVIAEGVETREQVIYLRTAGCDEVQGFYFQKPAAADEIRALLEPGSPGLGTHT